VRLFQRMLIEHRKLPRLVRMFRTGQVVGIALLIAILAASLIFRPSLAAMNMAMLLPLVVLFVSVVGVGLLTWRNYEKTAEIWAENVRSRGLNSVDIGWLMDTGTARAIGATKAIAVSVFAVVALFQMFWR
jgi:hypothetical protein